MSNGDKCYGEKQVGKYKKGLRVGRQGAILMRRGWSGKDYLSDIFRQKPESNKGLSYRRA